MRSKRFMFIAVATLLLLYGAAVVAVPRFVSLPSWGRDAARQLSDLLDAEVHFAEVRPVLWPLPGLEVRGVTAAGRRHGFAGELRDRLPAFCLRCAVISGTFSPLQLLHGRLVLSRLRLEALEIDLHGFTPGTAAAWFFAFAGVDPAPDMPLSASTATAAKTLVGTSSGSLPAKAPDLTPGVSVLDGGAPFTAAPATGSPKPGSSPPGPSSPGSLPPGSVMAKTKAAFTGLFFDPTVSFSIHFAGGCLRLTGTGAPGGRPVAGAADRMPVVPDENRPEGFSRPAGNDIRPLPGDGMPATVATGAGAISRAGLEMDRLEGAFRHHARRGDMRLRFTGRLLGGRVDGDLGWRDAADGNTEAGREVMLDAKLRGVGLLAAGITLPPVGEFYPRLTNGRVDFLLAAEGRLHRGLTVRASLGLDAGGVVLQAADGTCRELLGPGFTGELAASGYADLARRYLNLKSFKFDLPGALKVYSRGLLKFRERLLIDLLNDITIDDLEHCQVLLPGAFPAGIDFAGDLSGTCNLAGCPAELLVARTRLHSRRLVVRERASLPGATGAPAVGATGLPDAAPSSPAAGFGLVSPAATVMPPVHPDSGAATASTGIAGRVVDMLVALARSGVVADLSYTADRVAWNGVALDDVSFTAHKQLTRLDVEQCRAGLGDGGFRLSLVVEDLIHEPVWSASLRTESLDLQALLPGFPLAPGPATGFLVLEGQADPLGAVDYAALRGRGEVTFAAGVVLDTPLTRALAGFAKEIGGLAPPWPGAFDRAAAEIEIDHRRWRLKNLEIVAPEWHLLGAVVYDQGRQRLSGRGVLTGPAGSRWELRVSGPPMAPYYRLRPQ